MCLKVLEIEQLPPVGPMRTVRLVLGVESTNEKARLASGGEAELRPRDEASIGNVSQFE